VYGLEAIAAHNGWAQALTGAIIVMSGLAILSTVISFLPKLVNLFEEEKTPPPIIPQPEPKSEMPAVDLTNGVLLQDIFETAKNYASIIDPLGESFQLSDLYHLFKEKNLPHPHLTIKSFREAGLIFPTGKEGYFTWKLSSE
jgi:hypothetical protein